jgi:transglutaminase-like putative cysteine protease/predicted glutamine amidotransferase
MPNLLALSFEGELAPSIDLRCLHPGRKLPDGWGIGYYPGGEPSASVLKEPAPPQGSIRSELVKAWEHLESSIFVLHIRTATWGSISDANTQPFCRAYGGRDWLVGHSGSLAHRVEAEREPAFQPVGSTDTELIFCRFLAWLAARGARSLGDVDPEEARAWFHALNAHGSLTTVLTDGHDLLVYADELGRGQMHLWRVTPPYDRVVFGDADVEIDLTRRGAKSRKGVIACSDPLVEDAGAARAAWATLAPGSLVVIRQGAVRAEVLPPAATSRPSIDPRSVARPARAEVRRLDVRHRTVYRYTRPVEKSTHVFRLVPVHDRLQSLLFHETTVSVDGQDRDYEDVFGNRVRRLLIDTPFTELVIEARSRVELLDTDPLSFRPLRTRSTIPLVWMPWQRHMLQPFLLPPELPETELVELVEYAMSFVERNDYDLIDVLLDMNSSIFKEYRYVQGATTVATTPFETYSNRRGVCQDFTNLFICLARLLGIPARYVCGYIYTGPKAAGPIGANERQGEASHAWVQVYLPEVGWKGFDPTNGILTQTDHVRVAVGRSYVDATPTSGTIYVGGGGETLEVDVRCEPVE